MEDRGFFADEIWCKCTCIYVRINLLRKKILEEPTPWLFSAGVKLQN